MPASSAFAKEQIGFLFAGEPRGDAWCSICEEARIREGGETGDWNERSEATAKITVLCGSCYDQMQQLRWGAEIMSIQPKLTLNPSLQRTLASLAVRRTRVR